LSQPKQLQLLSQPKRPQLLSQPKRPQLLSQPKQPQLSSQPKRLRQQPVRQLLKKWRLPVKRLKVKLQKIVTRRIKQHEKE
jgi:hypothetical protein